MAPFLRAVRRLFSAGAVILLPFAFPSGARAQQPPAAQNQTIDGAAHPELVPDLDAYRIFFSAAVNNLDVMLNPIRLNDADRRALVSAVHAFGDQFKTLSDSYNANVADGTFDTADFLARRDALIGALRATLKSTLSKDGFKRLDAHIQAEKTHMQVAL